MHLINKGKPPKGGMYLQCSTAKRMAGCDNVRLWRIDDIERRLLTHLTYIDVDAVVRGDVRSGEADRVNVVKAKLSDLEQRTENVAGMIEIAKQRDPARLEQYRRLVEESEAVRDELAEAEKALAQAVADPGLAARLADAIDLTRAMDEAEGEERTAIRTRLAEQLRQLVEVIRFHPDIGIDAVLKARPGVPTENIPFIIGAKGHVPWRIDLNYDDDPRGNYAWDFPDDEMP